MELVATLYLSSLVVCSTGLDSFPSHYYFQAPFFWGGRVLRMYVSFLGVLLFFL